MFEEKKVGENVSTIAIGRKECETVGLIVVLLGQGEEELDIKSQVTGLTGASEEDFAKAVKVTELAISKIMKGVANMEREKEGGKA